MSVELYKKYRPKDFDEIIGQEEAVSTLQSLVEQNKVPHTILFSGPSGVGKTTLARILANKLHCSEHDCIEVNAADDRGIDLVRDIRQLMNLAPIGGLVRVWVIDECHQLTAQAQESFLKILEDTPKHVYFFLCSTDPQKLKKTIRTRCTEIALKEIPKQKLYQLVRRVYRTEYKKTLTDSVAKDIVEASEGSARKALVLLHQVAEIEDEEEQRKVIQRSDKKRQAVEIVRKLMDKKTSWKQLAEIIREVDEDPEQVRRMILGYASKVALSGGYVAERACLILDEFRDNWYDCGKAGLVISCWRVLRG